MNNNEQQQENEFPMSRNNEFWLKLTGEEVWLRAYSATFSDPNISYNGRIDSDDMCLYNFKQRFRKK